jgi:hypothetical protein
MPSEALADITSAAGKSAAVFYRPEHVAAAIALMFENFTTVCVAPCGPGSLSLEISDEDAIATLSAVWTKTLYGS